MKIRGYKPVVSKMPNEPADLRLIIKLLSQEDPKDVSVSETPNYELKKL